MFEKKKITFYDFETERIIKTEIKFKHPNGVIYIYDLIFVFDFRNQNRMTTMRFLVKTEQTTRPMDIFYYNIEINRVRNIVICCETC